MNSCKIIHLKTGIIVTSQTRDRTSSLKFAKEEMIKRLEAEARSSYYSKISSERKEQIGSGMRGDKIRTYQFQNDIATDHTSGKRISCVELMKGNMNKLWLDK